MKDLYKHLKGVRKKLPKKDFKESVFDLCDQYLKANSDLTAEQKTLVYRLRAFIEINFKGW